jgi:NAD kinase
MLRVYVVGLNKDQLILRIQKDYPELTVINDQLADEKQVTAKNCDLVICYGGDGTLLYGEQHIPGIPKMMLRSTMLCDDCREQAVIDMLTALSQKNYTLESHMKLEARSNNQTHLGLYDIMIGHSRINVSVRLRFAINGVAHPEEIVGDGLIISTPLGSTGYYQSITRSNFQSGIGIAFNNSVNTMSNLVVDEDAKIDVTITRGRAVVTSDNNEDPEVVDTDAYITIQKSQQQTALVTFSGELEKYNFAMNRFASGTCQLCQKQIV